MKKFYASKTFWFNIVAFIVVGILPAFGYDGTIPGDWQPFVLPAVVLINLVLRFITKEPLSL